MHITIYFNNNLLKARQLAKSCENCHVNISVKLQHNVLYESSRIENCMQGNSIVQDFLQ